MRSLVQQMARDSQSLMQTLADTALELCQAGTAGVSLLETTPDGEEVFRWTVLAGTLAHHVGGSTPRHFSPCGVCLKQGTPVLFSHPASYFTYFQETNIPFVEGLVLPLVADRHVLGTIWILSHDEQRQFDSEDVRIMTSLADFTATDLLLNQRQTSELLAVNAALEANVEEHRQAEAQLQGLISNLPGGATFVVDRDFRYLLAEGEALAIAGFKPEDFVGKTIFEVLPPDLAASYEPMYRQALAGEPFEHEHSSHDHTYISRGTPLYSAEDEVYAVLVVSYDISDRKAAEESLRQSEAKYRSLFESIDEGLCLFEMIYDEAGNAVDYRFLEINSVFERQTGLENAVGKLGSEIAPNTESYWLEAYDEVVKTGKPQRIENYNQATDRWYSAYASRVGGGGSRQVCTVFNDITERVRVEDERKRHDANLAFLAEVTHDLARLTDLDETMNALGEKIGRHFNLSASAFAELYGSDGIAVIDYNWHRSDVPSLRGTYRMQQFLTPEVMQLCLAGEDIVIRDVFDDPLTDGEQFATLNIGSFLSIPLIRNGEWQFLLVIYRSEPHDWRNDEIELTRELANRIWTRLERARAEVGLRESEVKYRSLFESIDEGYALCEVMVDENEKPVDVRYLEVNPAFKQLSGLENVVGKTAVELNLILEPFWMETFAQVIRTGEATRIEEYTEGVNRWLDVYFSRVGGEGSRQIAVVFNDITERKQTEEQLRHAAELDAFRVKLSDALRSLSDPVEIQRAAMRVLGEHIAAERVCYGELTDDGETIVIADNYLRGDAIEFIGQVPTSAYGKVTESLHAGHAFVFSDLDRDERLCDAEREAIRALSVISGATVPLVKQGRWVSSLAVHYSKPHQWTDDEIQLLQETADRTWDAVNRARAETALRNSEIQRIQEQVAREEERQRAEALAELDRAKTLFFSNISHEFRTPLTLSLAPLQDALSDRTHPLDPIHRERLELVHRNSLRLLKLVNTLLDFSRIEAGRMEAVYEPTDLATFTAELASVFRSAIERAGLQLMVDCLPLPELVYVDREMWEKIVLNLLSNAFKFTFKGEITVSLKTESRIERQAPTSNIDNLTSDPQTLTAELDLSISDLQRSSSGLEIPTSKLETSTSELETSSSELETPPLEPQATTSNLHVILQIHDTGTGIAPEHLPHLFERFYQVRGTQARTHEGSGIGLALVHELVRLQGGTIKVSSTVGEGTCFTIALPFGTDHLPQERIHTDRTQTSTAIDATCYVEEAERWLPADLDPPQPPLKRGESTAKVSLVSSVSGAERGDLGGSLESQADIILRSSKVLIVDDNADMREYLTRILSEYVQVEAVADGATALAAAQVQVPDLILSDVMMPGLDGFELLEALRADPCTREIPIILLSARAGEEAIVEGLEAGADDYLIKPFSAQELVSRVTTHLQMAQLRGEALQQERTMNRQKDEFISVVSHELNTPLVSILGWTRMLRSSPPNPVILNKALDTIERNATLQAKLVQDLLDLSRITAGKLRLNSQPIVLKPVIETAIATVSQTAANKSINLTWQEHVTEPLVVMGDGDRLQQVICNLLTNAIKFTPESGVVTLELSLMNDDHASDAAYAEIRVADTGIGIAADLLPHVFERFRQAESPHSAKGLGLGLAIAHHIVELHNGTICAESAGEGQGTTFIVRLPLPPRNNDFSRI